MKLACIILAHREPRQLARLVSMLEHPQVVVYLHVDRRAPLQPFIRDLSDAGVGNVVLLPRHRSRWGGPEIVDAVLEGLTRGSADSCDYFTYITGQDFPLMPVPEILTFFAENKLRSYMHHWPISESRHRYQGRDRTDFYTYTIRGRRETCVPRGEDISYLGPKGRLLNDALRARSVFKPKRKFPAYARPFAGKAWWNLSRPAVDHILRFNDEHPDYRRYHEHTSSPDELFFQSIIAGTAFADGNEVVNNSLRFFVWSDDSHGATLTVAHLPAMLAAGDLFGHKFDPEVDSEVLIRLMNRIVPAGELPPSVR